ncbi:hypothetical protein A3H77_02490 [Candidatus Kaiserbacteria bacterium RIFCSPLOWO2_02_FULL_56_11]|nr:MAG: hypothetical protein A3H77_02490 [Candidatus Kaiserbacteria bacterium RIFCSPLOWO2_02_FULL_56_11]
MGTESQLSELNAIATSGVLSAWGAASDFLIILVLVGVLFLFAWYVGRGPFIGLLMSFYVGYALYTVFPYTSYLPSSPAGTALAAALALYAVLAGIAYLVLRRAVVSDFVYIGLFGMALLAFFGAGFLLALAYHVFPVRELYTFTPAIDALFAPKEYFFWWFIAPLVGLFFLAR